MKFHWDQLSPKEKEAVLRHFLLQRKMNAPVSAEGVCAALRSTHNLESRSSASGKSVFEFVTLRRGSRRGVSLADDPADGVYKAALRARGVEIEDGLSIAIETVHSTTIKIRSARSARAAR